ncbi:HAD family hydrolase [Pseudactinotalea sp.]|uniref:HAD family hydrolase n=1 Tax=Pseudactinotalea sp. TaxID=1926260 RepID=UPI003B3BDB9A
MTELRDRGIAAAFVSNCAPNAAPLLSHLGLTAQVDAVILSCEVGSTKPDAEIYMRALEALAVDASGAVFVDDQATYCAGAEAIGLTAVRIDRHGTAQGAVQSLEDVLRLL